MKISELVHISYVLNGLSTRSLDDEMKVFAHAQQLLTGSHPGIEQVSADITALTSTVESFKEHIANTVKEINLEIAERTRDWYRRGYTINDQIAVDFVGEGAEREMRKTLVGPDTEQVVSTKINKYSSWQYPNLEIGPGDGMWTRYMVAGDPLYLVDVHKEFLYSSTNQFNSAYQKRIRRYQIGKSVNKTDRDLSALPKNQIGFIFAWNVFDYFPLDYTSEFLEQCFDLLRPGGVMLFSYNDCERKECAVFAEEGNKSWMPKWLLNETVTKFGFEILYHGSEEKSIHWIEIKKPGNLSSIKLHQPLATIEKIKGRIPIDEPEKRVYTKQQITRLHQIAIQLNLDTPENIMRGKYKPYILHDKIEKARNRK